MARPKKTNEGTGKPISIRLSDQYQDQLEMAAKRLDLPVSEVMRLCLRIGMEHFARIDYDTAKCIVDAVEKKRAPISPAPRFAIKTILGPESLQPSAEEQAASRVNEVPTPDKDQV